MASCSGWFHMVSCFGWFLAVSKNSSCMVTYHPSQKLSTLDEPDMQNTAGEVRMNS